MVLTTFVKHWNTKAYKKRACASTTGWSETILSKSIKKWLFIE